MIMYYVHRCLVVLYIFLLEMTLRNWQGTASRLQGSDNRCCNGVLGYARPQPFMPCSDLICCNENETVALQRVNHALGFCFRCMSKDNFQNKCYKLGEEVATTNVSTYVYDLRTCCSGLKFRVIPHTNDVALVIKCVRR